MYITAIYNFLAIMMVVINHSKKLAIRMKISKSTRGKFFRIDINKKKTFKGVVKIAKTINQVLQVLKSVSTSWSLTHAHQVWS